jgi:hypothetical protein
MIFSTITQNNLNLTADTTEIPAQYSNNIQFKFIQDNERFSGYIPTIYIGVYDSAMIECSDVISAGGAVVVDGDGVFAISNEIMYRNGFLAVGVTLTNNDENVSLKPVIYRIQASVGGLSPLPPDEGEWQQVVKAFVETLFNNWSAENLDPIKAQLEELISIAQTQQEKITSQQTQIDNAIGNMGDYEIVQEDPVQIRFKKGDGTFGEIVDLGDGLASKAMVNAGYYTYKGISYGGSASNNGIDVAEIDGAYSQVTTNGFQLFDASKLPTKSQGGATVTNNGDGSFTISGSGNLTSDFSCYYNYSHEETLKMLRVGTITLNQNGGDTTPYAIFRLVKGNSSLWIQLTKTARSANITQEMLQDNGCYIQVLIYGQRDSAIQTGTIKPMLYQDGDGTFEPFTGGIASPNPEYPQEPKFVGDYNEDTQKYDIDFMTSGKNLFDNKAIQRTWQCDYISKDDGSIEITPTATTGVSYIASEVIELRVGETYSLQSFENNEYFKNTVIWKANTTITAYKTNELFIVTEGNNLIQIGIYINNGSLSNKASFKLQLSRGEPKAEFIPFQGFETTTVELNQPLRELPNGVKDTVENGVVTRRVGVVTFDGSSDEAWKEYTGSTKTVHTYMINLDKPRGINDAICDKLVYIQDCWEKNIEFSYSTFAGGRGFYLNTNGEISTVDLFKTWLQSNPITVCYELATPTTEQITLPTLPSWYPYTDAWVGTELQPSFVEWHIKIAGVNQNDLTVIKEDISQLQTETTQLNDDVTKLMGAFTSVTDLTKQLFLLMHRVGDIIFSTSDENPSTIYGGTWVAWGKGQVPVGVDTSDSDFNTVEKTGGEKEHTLTVDEMPSHTHAQYVAADNGSGAGIRVDYTKDGTSIPYPQGIDTGSSGENQPHNNLQPYITCYMWKRTA